LSEVNLSVPDDYRVAGSQSKNKESLQHDDDKDESVRHSYSFLPNIERPRPLVDREIFGAGSFSLKDEPLRGSKSVMSFKGSTMNLKNNGIGFPLRSQYSTIN